MKNLYTKLHAFQAEIGTIKKSEVNPFFKSRYVDINGIIDAIKPLLDKHGLVIMQPLTNLECKPAIKTIVADIESGEAHAETMPLPENIDPQKMGSAITYFRRYALQSLLLLEAEDDDGNNASQTQNLPPRNDLKPKPVQLTEQEQIDEFNRPLSVDEMAAMMDGEVIQRKGPLPEGFRKFPDCPHENIKGSAYRKCYNCNLKREVS